MKKQIKVAIPEKVETNKEIEARIGERFDVLKELTDSVTDGNTRALIVSGPAGLGKSYTVETALRAWDPSETKHTFIKGFVRGTGLYKTLYTHRHAGHVIVFDDADSIFFDEVSLNLLKAACDTTDVRRLSWLAETNMVDEEGGERVERSFVFEGAIIFCTNKDFDVEIEKESKYSPHMQAMVSRAHYISLDMKNKRDYMVRIKMVLREGVMLKELTIAEKNDVMAFIVDNNEKLRELSLRMALKLGGLRKALGATAWQRTARVTCCKN